MNNYVQVNAVVPHSTDTRSLGHPYIKSSCVFFEINLLSTHAGNVDNRYFSVFQE